MKNSILFIVIFCIFSCITLFSRELQSAKNNYTQNRAPLAEQPYLSLPLGAVKPQGMLLKMLELQRDGMTGHLDSLYEVVCGDNSGWLGGTGDGWERGPYWLDGLVPLAWILDDAKLKAKAMKWINWSINNQQENGYFGPRPLEKGFTKIPGTQQDKREDYWPKMVMLKVLQQYYDATGDKRVITLMTKYFEFMRKELSQRKLGHYTWWAEQRGGDNLQIVYWLYNLTGDSKLLELAETIYQQTTPWDKWFAGDYFATVSPLPKAHCVNVSMGVKTPAVYYLQKKDNNLLSSIRQGLSTINRVHGLANGMFGGDENLHGNSPTTGVELCSIVEMMYSLESNLAITGDIYYADYLEKLAYNMLPTQIDDQFATKQYFQQANQIKIDYQERNFFNDDYGRLVYGLLTGYPCCTSNLHQGWPKFVRNLWYATSDNGLAALIYGESLVKAKVANDIEVSFKEETSYPFKNRIKFTFSSDENVVFPFHLRVPAWCKSATIRINDEYFSRSEITGITIIRREWKNGDVVELELPMEVSITRWAENSVAVERGPLLYALKMKEIWKEQQNEYFKEPFWEVFPGSDWNYGLTQDAVNKKQFEVTESENVSSMPWNIENAPLTITTKAILIPEWKEYNNQAGPLPRSVLEINNGKITDIELIPYGCTTLRISQFPVIRNIRAVNNPSEY